MTNSNENEIDEIINRFWQSFSQEVSENKEVILNSMFHCYDENDYDNNETKTKKHTTKPKLHLVKKKQ